MSMRVERSTLDQVIYPLSWKRWQMLIDCFKVKERFAKNKAKLEEKKVRLKKLHIAQSKYLVFYLSGRLWLWSADDGAERGGGETKGIQKESEKKEKTGTRARGDGTQSIFIWVLSSMQSAFFRWVIQTWWQWWDSLVLEHLPRKLNGQEFMTYWPLRCDVQHKLYCHCLLSPLWPCQLWVAFPGNVESRFSFSHQIAV